MRIFGREPAVIIEMLVSVALGVLLTAPLEASTLSYANAVVVAAGGVLTAVFVKGDQALPALTGFIKAVFALVIGLGVALPVNLETGIIAIVSAIGTAYVRTQVIAPVPPAADGSYNISSLPKG
jgi:hypothetical protein